MIHLLVTRSRDYPITAWLRSPRAADLGVDLAPLHYERLERSASIPPGTYVFTDLERFGRARLELAVRLWTCLAAHPDRYRLLNDPRQVLRRFELLRAMHEEGRNDFRAVRATDSLDGLRYPVFVRQELDHTGALTGLIEGRPALERHLRRLGRTISSGLRLSDLLVVEFVDTSGGSRHHVKYSAFRIGNRIVPRYRVVSPHWMVKADGRASEPEQLQAEIDYLDTDPHADWVRETFERARVEYGRIDYGEVDGRLQVWEINTNPTIGTRRRHGRDALEPRAQAPHPDHVRARSRFHAAFRDGLVAIDVHAGTSVPPRDDLEPFRPGRALARAARRERAVEDLGRRYRNWLRKPARYAVRVMTVVAIAWLAVLAASGLAGVLRPLQALLDLILLLPLAASLGYTALRTALDGPRRALAIGCMVITVPLIDRLGWSLATGAPVVDTGAAFRLAGFAVGLAVPLAVALAGERHDAERPVVGSGGAVREWSWRLAPALATGASGGALMLWLAGSSAGDDPRLAIWALLRGPLLLAAAAPLVAALRPGRWSPAWGLAAAMGLLGGLAWPVAGGAPAGIVAAASFSNALLGALLGLSLDPLARRRVRGWRRMRAG